MSDAEERGCRVQVPTNSIFEVLQFVSPSLKPFISPPRDPRLRDRSLRRSHSGEDRNQEGPNGIQGGQVARAILQTNSSDLTVKSATPNSNEEDQELPTTSTSETSEGCGEGVIRTSASKLVGPTPGVEDTSSPSLARPVANEEGTRQPRETKQGSNIDEKVQVNQRTSSSSKSGTHTQNKQITPSSVKSHETVTDATGKNVVEEARRLFESSYCTKGGTNAQNKQPTTSRVGSHETTPDAPSKNVVEVASMLSNDPCQSQTETEQENKTQTQLTEKKLATAKTKLSTDKSKLPSDNTKVTNKAVMSRTTKATKTSSVLVNEKRKVDKDSKSSKNVDDKGSKKRKPFKDAEFTIPKKRQCNDLTKKAASEKERSTNARNPSSGKQIPKMVDGKKQDAKSETRQKLKPKLPSVPDKQKQGKEEKEKNPYKDKQQHPKAANFKQNVRESSGRNKRAVECSSTTQGSRSITSNGPGGETDLSGGNNKALIKQSSEGTSQKSTSQIDKTDPGQEKVVTAVASVNNACKDYSLNSKSPMSDSKDSSTSDQTTQDPKMIEEKNRESDEEKEVTTDYVAITDVQKHAVDKKKADEKSQPTSTQKDSHKTVKTSKGDVQQLSTKNQTGVSAGKAILLPKGSPEGHQDKPPHVPSAKTPVREIRRTTRSDRKPMGRDSGSDSGSFGSPKGQRKSPLRTNSRNRDRSSERSFRSPKGRVESPTRKDNKERTREREHPSSSRYIGRRSLSTLDRGQKTEQHRSPPRINRKRLRGGDPRDRHWDPPEQTAFERRQGGTHDHLREHRDFQRGTEHDARLRARSPRPNRCSPYRQTSRDWSHDREPMDKSRYCNRNTPSSNGSERGSREREPWQMDAREKDPIDRGSRERDLGEREYRGRAPREVDFRERDPSNCDSRERDPRGCDQREWDAREGHASEWDLKERHSRDWGPREGHSREWDPGEGHPREWDQREGHPGEWDQREGHPGEWDRREGHPGEWDQREGHPGEWDRREGHPGEWDKREGHPGEWDQREGHPGEWDRREGHPGEWDQREGHPGEWDQREGHPGEWEQRKNDRRGRNTEERNPREMDARERDLRYTNPREPRERDRRDLFPREQQPWGEGYNPKRQINEEQGYQRENVHDIKFRQNHPRGGELTWKREQVRDCGPAQSEIQGRRFSSSWSEDESLDNELQHFRAPSSPWEQESFRLPGPLPASPPVAQSPRHSDFEWFPSQMGSPPYPEAARFPQGPHPHMMWKDPPRNSGWGESHYNRDHNHYRHESEVLPQTEIKKEIENEVEQNVLRRCAGSSRENGNRNPGRAKTTITGEGPDIGYIRANIKREPEDDYDPGQTTTNLDIQKSDHGRVRVKEETVSDDDNGNSSLCAKRARLDCETRLSSPETCCNRVGSSTDVLRTGSGRSQFKNGTINCGSSVLEAREAVQNNETEADLPPSPTSHVRLQSIVEPKFNFQIQSKKIVSTVDQTADSTVDSTQDYEDLNLWDDPAFSGAEADQVVDSRNNNVEKEGGVYLERRGRRRVRSPQTGDRQEAIQSKR